MHAVIKQFYRRTHLKKPEICVEAVEMTACTSVIPAPADTVIVWISGTGKDVYLHGQARKVKTTMSQNLHRERHGFANKWHRMYTSLTGTGRATKRNSNRRASVKKRNSNRSKHNEVYVLRTTPGSRR